jgi:hypothetical protein
VRLSKLGITHAFPGGKGRLIRNFHVAHPATVWKALADRTPILAEA